MGMAGFFFPFHAKITTTRGLRLGIVWIVIHVPNRRREDVYYSSYLVPTGWRPTTRDPVPRPGRPGFLATMVCHSYSIFVVWNLTDPLFCGLGD